MFEKLKAESIEILEDTTTPYGSTLIRLATALYLPLEGTVLDGHFTIGAVTCFPSSVPIMYRIYTSATPLAK